MANPKQPNQLIDVILLNKPFSGGWLDGDGNIAHEIIDFLQSDDEGHYIYDAPHGNAPDICVAGQNPVDEKYRAQYMILTGPMTKEAQGCSFDIKYIIRLKEKIHPYPAANWWKFWKSGDGKLFSKAKKEEVTPIVKDLLREFCSSCYVGKLEEDVRERVKERLARSDLGMPLRDPQFARITDRTVEAWKAYINARENHEKIVKLTKSITYNGKTLEQIYATQPGNDCSLNVTFKADGMYEADPGDPDSRVTCKSYVHQRVRGRLKNEGDTASDYSAVLKAIEKIVIKKEKAKEKFKPLPVEWNDKFSSMSLGEPFLERIGLGDNEQAFTNMLGLVLRTRNGDMMKEFCRSLRDRLPEKSRNLLNEWEHVKVMREQPATEALPDLEELEEGKTDKELEAAKRPQSKKGRMDVCAEAFDKTGNLVQRVIIENKIDSGLNGVDRAKNETQLSTYYQKWGRVATGNEPICLVVAPTCNREKIQRDIATKDFSMEGKYLFVDYGMIADFIDKHKGMIPEAEISPSFVDEIIRSFRAHSLSQLEEYTWMVLRKTESIV